MNCAMKIPDILQEASDILLRNGVLEPRREASLLLAATLQKNKTFLIAHPEYEPEKDEVSLFRSFIARRAGREPFHYITGVKEFYGFDFEVSPDVLIPRPETEMLVGNSIAILHERDRPGFCEVGIGSGCISVSILVKVEFATATGVDISEKALKIAKSNAEKHSVIDRLELRHSDIFTALSAESFDLIVSNPPYIPKKDMPGLQREVRDFEPHIALSDDGDGLAKIDLIVRQSPKFLKPGGFLVMEMGIGQETAVKAMFENNNWESVEILPDFQGIPRMVRARIRFN
ncbi:MAG: peptide chain release factor N(5)-glutamine methyltransferase [Acidobacteriota bacterium]|nr:peptide chain release factor N(5)-glutamine methyltransferase [Acidobacteriota bacterium]